MPRKFRQSFLYGSSQVSVQARHVFVGSFDIAIVVPSWDRRCVCVASAEDFQAELGLAILFDVRDEQGLRDRHDPTLLAFLKRKTRRVETIKGRSVDLDKIFKKLLVEIMKIRKQKKSPLRICLDISTCPRYYAMALLSSCLGSGIADLVTLFYAEGIYPKDDTGSGEIFTIGQWATIPVPGLNGSFDPGKRRFYLVSVGFEGAKTLRVVARADPERVSILFPDPAVKSEYILRARESNRELIDSYRIPGSQIVPAHAGDAIGAWAALAGRNVERPDFENTSYLCCGTKPHSIALALRAMALRYPTVLYNLPGEHRAVPIEAGGKFWRYDIRDISAIESNE